MPLDRLGQLINHTMQRTKNAQMDLIESRVYKRMAMTICTITGVIVLTMILVVLVWVNYGKKRHSKIAKRRQPTDIQIVATRDVEIAAVPLMITCDNVNKIPTESVLKPDGIVTAELPKKLTIANSK